jgi:hypothetical protein
VHFGSDGRAGLPRHGTFLAVELLKGADRFARRTLSPLLEPMGRHHRRLCVARAANCGRRRLELAHRVDGGAWNPGRARCPRGDRASARAGRADQPKVQARPPYRRPTQGRAVGRGCDAQRAVRLLGEDHQSRAARQLHGAGRDVTTAVQAHTRSQLPGGYSIDRVAWIDVTEGRMPLCRNEAGTLRLLEHAVPDSPSYPAAPVFYFLTGRGRGLPSDTTTGRKWCLGSSARRSKRRRSEVPSVRTAGRRT